MNTTKWGPSGWIFLHSIAAGYPDVRNIEVSKNYWKFYLLMHYILPCKYCRYSYLQYLGELRFNNGNEYNNEHGWLQNNLYFQYFVYALHKKVNHKLENQGNKRRTYDPEFHTIHTRYEKRIEELSRDNLRKVKFIKDIFPFIFAVTWNYGELPHINKDDLFHKMFNLLRHVLPNPIKNVYQKHYNEKYEHELLTIFKSKYIENIDDYNTCQKLQIWLYNLYKNIVEDLGGKVLSFKQTRQKYNSWRAKCSKGTCR